MMFDAEQRSIVRQSALAVLLCAMVLSTGASVGFACGLAAWLIVAGR